MCSFIVRLLDVGFVLCQALVGGLLWRVVGLFGVLLCGLVLILGEWEGGIVTCVYGVVLVSWVSGLFGVGLVGR